MPDSPDVLWLGTILIGLGLASVFPTALTFGDTLLVTSGTVTGWFLVGTSIGAMTLPWLIGQVFESAGSISLIGIVLGGIVFAFITLILIIRLSRLQERAVISD